MYCNCTTTRYTKITKKTHTNMTLKYIHLICIPNDFVVRKTSSGLSIRVCACTHKNATSPKLHERIKWILQRHYFVCRDKLRVRSKPTVQVRKTTIERHLGTSDNRPIVCSFE